MIAKIYFKIWFTIFIDNKYYILLFFSIKTRMSDSPVNSKLLSDVDSNQQEHMTKGFFFFNYIEIFFFRIIDLIEIF